jgi:hypothetical protein
MLVNRVCCKAQGNIIFFALSNLNKSPYLKNLNLNQIQIAKIKLDL